MEAYDETLKHGEMYDDVYDETLHEFFMSKNKK